MIRALALLLAVALPAAALPAAAQEAPTVGVALDPSGPVTVGSPVRVALTVLVPSYMPQPPQWPDMQIADAITRLPERATTPVTRRIGNETWSGLTRTYEIVPQRAADYDLADAAVVLTWAGDDGPQTATLPVPDIAFSAAVPPGAEGLDPFLAAAALTVAATAEGLPEAPKPGDALTLTLATTASGPPAMLLPPLADRIPVPAGLRAYPKEPVLTDARDGPPTATRVESVTYVIEAPGRYVLPAVSLDWWDLGRRAVATASTEAIAFDVAAPPGWKAPGEQRRRPALLATVSAIGAALLLAAAIRAYRAKARRPPRPPSERRLYRALRRSVRHGPAGDLRGAILAWLHAAGRAGSIPCPELEAALLAVERTAFGPSGADQGPGAASARARLASTLAETRHGLLASPASRPGASRLPPLNPQPVRQRP